MHELACGYIQTASGAHVNPLAMTAGDLWIDDIAHSLAMTCRFRGHTSEFYSVAQHSVLVSRLVEPSLTLAALLHDAAEAYLGDMSRPLKYHDSFAQFRAYEEAIELLVNYRWHVDVRDRRIKHADLLMCVAEMRDLMPHVTPEGDNLALQPEADRLVPDIKPWPWKTARHAFLTAYNKAL